jgi:hypothetical protein
MRPRQMMGKKLTIFVAGFVRDIKDVEVYIKWCELIGCRKRQQE